MDSIGVVDLWRKEMMDETTPYLWSEDEAYSFLDDAQKMFCRLTGGIADSMTPGIVQLNFGIDDATVVLSPLILKVRAAYRVSDGAPIDIINYENMLKFGMRFDGRTGPVRTLILGADSRYAYYYPIASIADAIYLLVDRLPLEIIKAETQPQELEIDEMHHRHLMLWMKALAFEKQDSETFDKSKAKEFDAKFRAYCFDAKLERERRIHKPRAVTYGGLLLDHPVRRDY